MKLLVAVIFVLSTCVIAQVEHAPTVAQCQADQRLWFANVEGPSEQLPSYDVIKQWSKEMSDCRTVDPENTFRYYNTSSEIAYERISRMVDFMARHNLWGDFKAEDAAGKR